MSFYHRKSFDIIFGLLTLGRVAGVCKIAVIPWLSYVTLDFIKSHAKTSKGKGLEQGVSTKARLSLETEIFRFYRGSLFIFIRRCMLDFSEHAQFVM